MSIKKMALLVSSGLVFFLVASIVINTVSVTRKKAMNKISSIIKYEINPDVTVSSYNFVEVVPEQEEVKEEEVIVAEPVEEVKEEVTVDTSSSSDVVYVGKMTGYGADCVGCNGVGYLACHAQDGSVHTLTGNGDHYNDATYGSVRIVAADLSQFPCGTIVTVDHPVLGTFNAVVLDTGGSMRRAWQNGLVWMDLAYTTESDPAIYSTTSKNTTYTVQRWGW